MRRHPRPRVTDDYDMFWALATFPPDHVPLVLDRLAALHAAGVYGGQARLAVLSLLPQPETQPLA